jgi:uncharacterized protein YecE (DUF72 family)
VEEYKMMNIYVGTSGFAHKEWKGKFYPNDISPKDMIRFYAERLNSVEINNTFYHMPKESVLMSWAERVPQDFVFALKAPQVITHIKRLRNVFDEAEYLFRSLSVMDRKLGPILFQFPKSFRADKLALKDFLALIPDTRSCAFEFRSPTWNDVEILDLLRERGFSLCISDTDENPTNVIASTASWGYLRLRRSNYTDADLSRWVAIILTQQWEKTFVFFKHEGDATGAKMAMRFQELIDSRLDTKTSKQVG